MQRALTFVGGLLLGAALALPALAQDYPTKQPIKIVVAVPAGGLTDGLARVTAEFLQKRIGQAVVVENRPGASSTIGADYVSKAPADGYTLLMAGAEQAVVPAVRSDVPYNLEDFTFLIRGFTNQPLILVNPQSPISSVKDLVAEMKANPGKIRYGTTGVGAILHMGMALFEGAAGVKGVHIPYAGIAPAYTDLLAGNIDLIAGGSAPFPTELKVIGTVGTKRSPLYPDLPTYEESGITGAAWDSWFGLVAPPNLPKPIADKLIEELSAVFKDPEAIEKFKSATKSVPEATPLVGDDFKKQALQERTNWTEVAKREKVVVQQ